MLQNLSKSILETVAYYDVLSYPMTSFEIWKYLLTRNSSVDANGGEIRLSDVVKELEGSDLKKYIGQYHGFYFLKGRNELADERIKRNKISEEKFMIIRRVTNALRFVPFVRMVAVTGRVAMKNAKRKSDLDLLIVIEEGKIFTGRLLVTGLVHLIGKRRYGNKIKDRICLNHFITTGSREIMLKDLFSSSEYSFMLPMFGQEEYDRFRKDNSWIRDYHCNYQPSGIANLKIIDDSWLSSFPRKIGEKILSAGTIEEKLGDWQKRRIENDPRTHQEGGMTVADSKALIFLPHPQGPRIFEIFKDRIGKLLD
ncbi:MAG: hypothetical protein HGB08_03320 [Candidatus Moranbacteria bacterium]|nr:hypothetical protein [Candidatus Moranbacteria bacterium]